jgi:phospholipase A1/A2
MKLSDMATPRIQSPSTDSTCPQAFDPVRISRTLFLVALLLQVMAIASPAYSETARERPGLYFTPHKLNYFILNGLPPDDNAQVKFQISAKFQVVEWSDYRFFFAYTQKSFWDIGKASMPFQENNYNPEFFISREFDRPIWGNLELHEVSLGPIEHESNGLAGSDSRSWNRTYIASSFGLEPRKPLAETPTLIRYRFLFSIKLWVPYDTGSEDDYLDSIGRGNERFTDYAGWGEVGASLRDIYFSRNQIDFKTNILHAWGKGGYEFGYHQNIPRTDFYLYAQYWYGYNESLNTFADSVSHFKIGFSFFF